MEICVFGAGSLGTLVGGRLAEEHSVTLVGRDPHVSAIEAGGVRISGAIEATTYPAAATTPPEAADLAVVTVKSFDTPAAAEALADCSLDAVLSLQNGLGNEETLAAGLEAPVLAATCTYGARRGDPGTVECTGIGEITIGTPDGGPSSLAEEVVAAFSAAGLVTEYSTAMPEQLWLKLAVNAGINATTALARVPNGALLDGPADTVAAEAARETARVARKRGVDISEEAAVRRTREVAEATAANTSSMQQDVRAAARTEIDAINGYVAETAEKTPVPVNETLAALIRAWEHERGLRS
ncbi:2-dehydropantoate 2-reductase [Halovenus sp. WSH3]|uniref:2-dehydropantoate 2-reductase n=1 Tax=Halovenus carboxidivorans TaxID=2692199 RepID=A0A6B0TAE3_9EURY|nr:ketopantoate reductase family protein [Halovenus carboxidivorans]MXR52342.1 2-dehydropantoate 2-reductase [Halovenus carboxidivorans]